MSKYHLDSTQFTGEEAETAASKYSSPFCLLLHLPVYLPVCLPVCLSAWLSSCLSAHLSICVPFVVSRDKISCHGVSVASWDTPLQVTHLLNSYL